MPVAHIVKNNLAFRNNMDGFTDNFNPGSLTLENNVAIDNVRFNYLFRKSPYEAAGKQGSFINNQSYRFSVASQYSDVVNGETLRGNRFIVNGVTTDEQGQAVDLQTLEALKSAVQLAEKDAPPSQAQVVHIRGNLKQWTNCPFGAYFCRGKPPFSFPIYSSFQLSCSGSSER